MEVVALEGEVIVLAGPLTCVHVPVPAVGVFPAMDTDEAQVDWSGPAFAVVTDPPTVIDIWSLVVGQDPLVIVHWKT